MIEPIFVCKFVRNKSLTYKFWSMKKYKFTVQFRLEKRKDTPKDKDGKMLNPQILADITFDSKRIFYYVGYRIDEAKWINDKAADGTRIQQAKKNTFNKRGESATEINMRLREIKQAVENVFHRLEVNDVRPTTNIVRDELKKELDEEARANRPLVEYYAQFIEEAKENNTWTKATVTKHQTLISHIQGYRKHIEFDDITEDFFNAFIRYLINEKNLSNPYIVKLIKNFKTFMNWATKKGFNKTIAYKTFEPQLKGVSTSDKTNIIALSPEEFMHLYDLPIKTPCLERVRDVFCFCCATSLRYSDVRNLKWSNIKEDRIELVTIKTDDPIVIYFNDLSYPIIKKYEQYKNVSENVLPVISNQKYNDYLKELGKLAGFDQPTTKVIFKGSERIERTVPKYELLTSHVARKTFVTLALYKGIPAEVVRSFTGHKDAKVMERYFKFNGQEKKNQMQNFNFKDEALKTVFDYDITDAERAILDIEEKDEYMEQIAMDKDLAIFHLARLFQRRGNKQEMVECVQKLSKERMVEFLQVNGL